MSAAQFRGKGRVGALYVPRSTGGVRLRTCGTSDRLVVREMKKMLTHLRGVRRWLLLDAVVEGSCSLGRLYDAYVANRLDQLERGVARLRGTKNAKRHVHEAIIEPWALPALRAYLSDLMWFDQPWVGLTRYQAAWYHAIAAKAAGAEGYTLRMARHSVAVRARKAGRSFEWIAAQLGNSVGQVQTVYARFELTIEERLDEANATSHATNVDHGKPALGGHDG